MSALAGIACAFAAANAVPVVPVASTRSATLLTAIHHNEFRLRTAVMQRVATPLMLTVEPTRNEERWVARDLVATDREAGRNGYIVRRPHMTAGLSLRLTNANGVLAPVVGMSGPAGRALTRLAVQAANF